jgi:hypothetical protein
MPFTIKMRYSKLGIDTGKFTATLDTDMKVQIKQAARAWLKAVILKVPIWTGTSRASLQPLGAYLKVAVPISPLVTRKGYGLSEGRAKQEFSFSRDGNVWSFEFTEEVAHYLVNEYFNANEGGKFHLKTPGPYRSFAAGEAAFNEYINTYLLSRVPNLKDFIIEEAITIGG